MSNRDWLLIFVYLYTIGLYYQQVYRSQLLWVNCDVIAFFNAIYFGTNKIDDFKKLPGSNEAIKKCLHFTEEVIQKIFKPKCIVCLSVPECFDNLNREFKFLDVKDIDTIRETDADLIDFAMNKKDKGWKCRYSCKNKVKKGFWNGIPIYGIPHTSGSVSNDDWGAIALYLRSEMQKLGI